MQYDVEVVAKVQIRGNIRLEAVDEKEAYTLALEYIEYDFRDFIKYNGGNLILNSEIEIDSYEGGIWKCDPVVDEEEQ